ncbi:MAG TPA: GNAT family N-acetyltransferase [Acidimicrobiia bacterium]|nr:GNAT family N-acetyltransferase [Acidimicrobiia bacterium]
MDAYPGWADVSVGARMEDATLAAVGLIDVGGKADSIPFAYGGIVASRRLLLTEVESLLDFARRSARTPSLECRAIPVTADDGTRHDGGTVSGWSQAVFLPKGHSPEARWAYKARRAIRIAREAGADVRIGREPEPFLRLYRTAAKKHIYRFPDRLLEALGATGLMRFYDVLLEDNVVSSVAALVGRSHWIAWLAAQDSAGRAISGNYLAVGSLLEDAYGQGVGAVNFGVSTGMPTVAHFKRRFDAVEVPVIRHVISSRAHGWRTSAKIHFRLGRRSLRRFMRSWTQRRN